MIADFAYTMENKKARKKMNNITEAINACFKDEIQATFLDDTQDNKKIIYVLTNTEDNYVKLTFEKVFVNGKVQTQLTHVDGAIYIFEIDKINELLERG